MHFQSGLLIPAPSPLSQPCWPLRASHFIPSLPASPRGYKHLCREGMAAWRAVQSNRTRQPLQEIGGTEANFLSFSHCVAFYVCMGGGGLSHREGINWPSGGALIARRSAAGERGSINNQFHVNLLGAAGEASALLGASPCIYSHRFGDHQQLETESRSWGRKYSLLRDMCWILSRPGGC